MYIWQFADSSLLAYNVVSIGKHRRIGGAICLLYLFTHFTPKAANKNTVPALSGIINHCNVLTFILRDSPKYVFIFCTP